MSGATPTDVLELTTDPDDVDRLLADLEDPANARLVRDDFAGPGGWSTGIADLLHDAGLTEVALEWDAAACATRIANGHTRTLRADVAAYPVAPFLGRTVGYIGSPPCQTFSMAGGGSGRAHLELLCECVRGILLGRITYLDAIALLLTAGALDREPTKEEAALGEDHVAHLRATGALADPRNGLILIPARVIRGLLDHDGLGPHDLEWIALEQVPTARLVYQAYATALRELGWSARAVVLNSADYGVPQTRERVFLMASRVRTVGVPEPTHGQGEQHDDLFGAALLSWIGMARALGWGMTDRPYEAGRFLLDRRTNSKGPNGTTYPTPLVDGIRPAPTVTSQTGGQWVVSDELLAERRAGSEEYDGHWTEDRPATVVASREIVQRPGATKNRYNDSDKTRNDGLRITEPEGAVLQGFPADYAWQGRTKGKRWEQIGNVVCPPVARRVVAEVLGVEPAPLPWHSYAFVEVGAADPKDSA